MTYEHDRALMEGARNSACDDYFSARPQIDTIDRRRVYEAGFQAGAASRDAEVAQWQRIIDEEAKDSALVIIERDQLRTELAAALAACKMKDETLQELDQLIPVGATIAALAIQPDDAALKAWLGMSNTADCRSQSSLQGVVK